MVHFSFARDVPRFFPFRLSEERRLIIDFIRSLGSLGPVVHTTPEEFKNATITGHFIFLTIKSKVTCD